MRFDGLLASQCETKQPQLIHVAAYLKMIVSRKDTRLDVGVAKRLLVYTRNRQTTARGPDVARLAF